MDMDMDMETQTVREQRAVITLLLVAKGYAAPDWSRQNDTAGSVLNYTIYMLSGYPIERRPIEMEEVIAYIEAMPSVYT